MAFATARSPLKTYLPIGSPTSPTLHATQAIASPTLNATSTVTSKQPTHGILRQSPSYLQLQASPSPQPLPASTTATAAKSAAITNTSPQQSAINPDLTYSFGPHYQHLHLQHQQQQQLIDTLHQQVQDLQHQLESSSNSHQVLHLHHARTQSELEQLRINNPSQKHTDILQQQSHLIHELRQKCEALEKRLAESQPTLEATQSKLSAQVRKLGSLQHQYERLQAQADKVQHTNATLQKVVSQRDKLVQQQQKGVKQLEQYSSTLTAKLQEHGITVPVNPHQWTVQQPKWQSGVNDGRKQRQKHSSKYDDLERSLIMPVADVHEQKENDNAADRFNVDWSDDECDGDNHTLKSRSDRANDVRQANAKYHQSRPQTADALTFKSDISVHTDPEKLVQLIELYRQKQEDTHAATIIMKKAIDDLTVKYRNAISNVTHGEALRKALEQQLQHVQQQLAEKSQQKVETVQVESTIQVYG